MMTMILKLTSTGERKKSDAPNFICQQNQICSLGTKTNRRFHSHFQSVSSKLILTYGGQTFENKVEF